MARTEIYVDPSIAGNSGSGTSGDPYGDLRYGIEQTTFDTTNGTRVNIKAGTAETLTESVLTSMADTGTTPAWAPTESALLVFEGYTATAGDGGIAEVNCGGFSFHDSVSRDYMHVKNLKVHNCGANQIIRLGDFCSIINVEAYNTTGTYALYVTNNSLISHCKIYTYSNRAIYCNNSVAFANKLDATDSTTISIQFNNESQALRNIIYNVTGAATGIQMREGAMIENNSIHSVAGATGIGIKTETGGTRIAATIANNIIMGFDGAGGDGIDASNNNSSCIRYEGNSFRNCTTNATFAVDPVIDNGNETLSVDPFTDPTNGDMSPIDTGSIKEGHLPSDFYD